MTIEMESRLGCGEDSEQAEAGSEVVCTAHSVQQQMDPSSESGNPPWDKFLQPSPFLVSYPKVN